MSGQVLVDRSSRFFSLDWVQQSRSEPGTEREGPATRGVIDRELLLRHAGRRMVTIRYEVTGPSAGPLLLVAGGISADRHVVSSSSFPEAGWWECQREPLSAARLFAIDWMGMDGMLDCPIDPADQALAIGVVLEELQLGRSAGFIGASYGGMVGMHLRASSPGSCGALLAISAAAAAHPFSSAWRAMQRKVVALGERACEPSAGVALARALAMMSYRTPEEYRARFGAAPVVEDGRVRVAAEDYLSLQGTRHASQMPAVAYRRLSESIDLHRIEPDRVSAPATLVASDSDLLVPLEDVRTLADAIDGARFVQLKSPFGHDAFLKEEDAINRILVDFIASLEPAQ